MTDRYAIRDLYYDLVQIHPGLAKTVNLLLGGDGHISARWREADETAIEAVAGVVIEVDNAWAASHGVTIDDSPAVLRELTRLRARAEAQRIHAEQRADLDAEERPVWADLIVDGKTWLTSGPDAAQPLWGDHRAILAALDQPTTIAGPQGAGKTVVGQRLGLGWLGLVDDILGLPVHHGDGNVLYLACDRPEQARLSMRRMLGDDQLDDAQARMRIWKGPPPEDVAKTPTLLLRMTETAEAGLLVIDSVKDVAVKLSADEVGAAYNIALQHVVAAGVQIIGLHHPRKLGGDNRGDQPVRTLDDLYGSTWLTAGNGSVLYLQPGALDGYTITQLKSPIGTKVELSYEHVHETGDLRPITGAALIDVLIDAGDDGISAVHAARCLYRVERPEEAQRKKVARALNELVEEGVAEIVSAGRGKKWRAVE